MSASFAQVVTPMVTPLPATLCDLLESEFGTRFTRNRAVCEQHGTDESAYLPVPPQAVVFAESNDDVVTIINACAAQGVPVIPFGVGSSIEGHLLAVRGGVCIDISRMNRVLELSTLFAIETGIALPHH